jgi:hypothetical protein
VIGKNMTPAKTKKPRRSAFDPKEPTADVVTILPQQAKQPSPHLGKKGTEGINVAGEPPPRNRAWEKEHQYGQGYSVKGVRPDVSLWLITTSEKLGVPVAEVAVYTLKYSIGLVEAGELIVKEKPGLRGSLFTLFPEENDSSTDGEVKEAIATLAKRIKKGKETRKEREKKLRDGWRRKTITWIPFDQELKSRISEYCRDHLPQGEFITFLLERARADYLAGRLVFHPVPKDGAL